MSQKKGISRRTFLEMVGAAGGVAALAACTVTPVPQQPAAEEAPAAPAAEGVTINVLTVGDPWDLALQNALDPFVEATGIQVNIESLGYVALQARLINSFLGQTADADVIGVDQMWISQYADNGWISNLDDFISGDPTTDIEDFVPQVLYSCNTWRGHVWTLPVAAYAHGIMYRTDLFEQAGLDPLPAATADAGDWTWDKYFGIVDQLNGAEMDGTTFYGTVVIGAQPVPVVHMYTQLSASYGTQWFTQFPQAPWDFTPTMNSPQNIAAMEDWVKLYGMAPPESINYLWFDAGTRFSQGDIALFYHWTPYFYLVNNEGYLSGQPSPVVDKFKTAVMPTKEAGGDQVISLGGWALGMPSTAANKDAAWQFINYATGAEGQKTMGLVDVKGHQFADFARKSLYQDEELRALYPHLDTQMEMMLLGNGKVARPPVPIYTSLEAVYGLQINQAMSGTVKPDAALETTQTLFQNILTGNQMIPYQVESYDDTLENTISLMASLAS
jgi:multiple sugar transport system substrate-binding protein